MKKIIFLLFTFHFSLFTLSAQYLLYGTTSGYYDASHHLHYGSIYCYNPATNKQTVLFNFNDTDGSGPIGRLLYASDSLLYGFTGGGGSFGKGTVFSFNPKNNVETVVINLNGANGGFLSSGLNELIQAKDSLLYGTTFAGGASNAGILFSYNIKTHKDSIRCVFNDSTSNPRGPYMELWQDASSGILYGVTERGGYPGGGGGVGFNPTNNKLIRYYTGQLSSSSPWQLTAGLTFSNNTGLLYGMSEAGGTFDSGTIYSFNLNTHILQTVFQFSYADGEYPDGNELLYLSNGLLYGATADGGSGYGVLFSFDPVNKIENVLHTFNNTDGNFPFGRLVQDPDNGILYGITAYGGDSNYGVLFSYDVINSTYTKLLDFKGSNGEGPLGGLTLVDTGKKDVGVSELRAKSEEVKVFPNPGSGRFTIAIMNYELGIRNVEVYNVFGERVYFNHQMSKSSNYQIDLSSQPNGVYFYRVVGENGGLVGSGKVVIEK